MPSKKHLTDQDLSGNKILNAGQIQSTVQQGTTPITVESTTLVKGLNADMIDGRHAEDFVLKTEITESTGNAVPEFDVIVPKHKRFRIKYTHEGLRLPCILDRIIGLRFIGAAPASEWTVKLYIYHPKRGKKYIPVEKCLMSDTSAPYPDLPEVTFRALPPRLSLMNIMMKAFVPTSDAGGTNTDTTNARLWLTKLTEENPECIDVRHGVDRYPLRTYPKRNNKQCTLWWSASFGIRLIAPDGTYGSSMKTFRVGVLDKGGRTYSFSMKNKI